MIQLLCYKIEHFGLYKKLKNGDFSFKTGNISDVLSELKDWVYAQDSVEATKTYDVHEECKSGIEAVYCKGLLHSATDNSYLLTIWNEVPNGGSSMASISRNEPLTQAEVKSISVDPNSIPGFPTYFWFLPDHNIFATVRLDGVHSGTNEMTYYLKNFLKWFTSEAIIKIITRNNEKIRQVRYGTEKEYLYPKFEHKMLLLESKIEYFKKNADSITKVIRKGTITDTTKQKNGKWDWFSKILLIRNSLQPKSSISKYNLEIEFEPTAEEVVELINSCPTNERDENVAFVINQKKEWLHSAQSRVTLQNAIPTSFGLADEQSLLDALSLNLQSVLKRLEL